MYWLNLTARCQRGLAYPCPPAFPSLDEGSQEMVHGAPGFGGATASSSPVMFYRDPAAVSASLGLPKSPSFHSGLDLLASASLGPNDNGGGGVACVAGASPNASMGVCGEVSETSFVANTLVTAGIPRQLPSLMGAFSRFSRFVSSID